MNKLLLKRPGCAPAASACTRSAAVRHSRVLMCLSAAAGLLCALAALTAKCFLYCYRVGAKCKTCKSTLHQPEALYCQGCAYSKGICALCGAQILDTEKYKQSK